MSGALVPGDQTIVGNLTVAGEIVGFGNKVATDGNGDLRVAHKHVSFALSSGKGVGLSRIRDEVEEQGEASVKGGTDHAQASLQIVGPEGLARLSTVQKGRCDVGRTVEVGVALRLSHAEFSEGQVARWGYFDDKDGFMYVMDGAGLGVAVRHSGGDQIFRRSDWNVDKLDGEGPSGISFDPTLGAAMYQILFTWGVQSAIVFRVVLTNGEGNQFVQIVHRIEALSEKINHVVQRFVVPIRAEVEWLYSNGEDDHPGERSAHVTGRYFSIIGGSAEEVRWGTSTPPRLTAAYSVAKRFSLSGKGEKEGTESGFVPLLSVRRKSDYADDGGRVELSDMDIVFDSIFADVLFVLLQVRVDSALGGEGADWEKLPHVPSDETALEQDTKATELEGGIVVFSSLIITGRNESRKTVLVSNVGVPDGRHGVTVCIKPLNVIGESSSIAGGASCLLRLKEAW